MTDKGLFHTCYTPQGVFVGDFTPGVIEYQHEWQEGPQKASFVLETGKNGVTDSGLRAWFERRIMWQVVTEFEGRQVWNGYIWELELEYNGVHYRKTMQNVANAILISYSNDEGELQYLTDDDDNRLWVTHPESILLYGRREKIININTESDEEALERANTEIKYSASPYTVPPTWRDQENGDTKRANRLTVTCVGRHSLANNIQLLQKAIRLTEAHRLANIENSDTYAYRNETTVSAEILRIVELVQEIGGWLYPLNIAATNDTPTRMGVPSNAGSWDRLLELARLRDTTERFYRLYVEPDGGVVYLPFDETPDYFLKLEPTRIEYADKTVPTWQGKPGIVRVIDSQFGPSLPDTWLTDRRNIFAERTTMRDGDKVASFHNKEYDVADYYASIEANARWLKEDETI